MMLREMRDQVEPEKMRSILDGVATRMVSKAPPAAANETLPQRMERVVKFLNTQGYDASWELDRRGLPAARPQLPVSRCGARKRGAVRDGCFDDHADGRSRRRSACSGRSAAATMCTYFIRNGR